MRRVNLPFPELLIEVLLDERLLAEANLINREALDEFVRTMAEELTDPVQKAWLLKMLPGVLLNSVADARRATPEDMPEVLPAWMQKLPDGTAFDVFEPGAATVETVKAVVAYLNGNPNVLTTRSTWPTVIKALADAKVAAIAASGDAWRFEDHDITRVRAGKVVVYTIAPRDNVGVREKWVTVTVTADAKTLSVKKCEGYALGVANSGELRKIAKRLIDEEKLNLVAGTKSLAKLSGGHAVLLLVSDTSRDWVGLNLKNCIGDGGYDLDKDAATYALVHGTTHQILAAMEFKNGSWAQTRQAENLSLEPGLKALFDEFTAQPGLRLQTVRLKGDRMKLSNELSDGDHVLDALWLEGVRLNSLPSNLSVDGSLVLKGSTLTELPPGLKVSGLLDIRKTAIQTLPEDAVFTSLRATFGTISHAVVGEYVWHQMKGDVDTAVRPKHAAWARTDQPPKNWTQQQIDDDFEVTVMKQLRADIVAWKPGAISGKGGLNPAVVKALTAVYA